VPRMGRLEQCANARAAAVEGQPCGDDRVRVAVRCKSGLRIRLVRDGDVAERSQRGKLRRSAPVAVVTVLRSLFPEAVVQNTPPGHACVPSASHAETTSLKSRLALMRACGADVASYQRNNSSAIHSLSS
jgi:hypothetical protein